LSYTFKDLDVYLQEAGGKEAKMVAKDGSKKETADHKKAKKQVK